MQESTNQPQAVYSKAGGIPAPTPVGTPQPAATSAGPALRKNERKIFGMKMRNFGILIGIVILLIIGGATWFILRQGVQTKESVAPTRPQAAETLSCTLSFTVAGTPQPTPTAQPLTCNSFCESTTDCTNSLGEGYECYDVSDTESRCRLSANTASELCEEVATVSCNSSCEVVDDKDPCTDQLGDKYYCSQTYDNTCRHVDYPAEADCEKTDYVPPTPAPACNDVCETNSDCANPDHVCYETSDGKRCRLDEYVWSSYCVKPEEITQERQVFVPGTEVVEETVTNTVEQPELPKELPETGAGDIAQFAVIAGAIFATALGLLLLL